MTDAAGRPAGITPSPSARRAGQLLTHLARRPLQSLSVSELARALGLNRATCQAVLMALEESGFVRRDPRTKAYSLGAALVPLGEAALASLPVVGIARPEVDRLALATGVEAAASIALTDEFLIVAVAGPPHRLPVRVGQAVPLAPPFGTSFVAWSGDEGIKEWLARAAPMSDEQHAHYVASLRAVRERGYSVTLEISSPERFRDAIATMRSERYRTGRAGDDHHRINQLMQEEYVLPAGDSSEAHRVEQVSAPVFDEHGDVALVLGLTGFSHDVTIGRLAGYVTPLLAATHRLTAQLGGRPPE